MTPLVVAAAAGWLTLRVLGYRSKWPWRVADLDLTAPPNKQTRQVSRRRRRPTRPAQQHRLSARGQREVTSDLAAAADLLRVAVSAGRTLHGAVAVAADFGDGPVCRALGEAHARVLNGASLVDELAALPERLGPASRSFASTLIVAHSSGAPASPALQRLADIERRRARRQIEERVRRLPTLLLLPLVGLVLPAFVVLAIVPVVLVTAEIELAGPAGPRQSHAASTNFPPPQPQVVAGETNG